MRRTRSLIRVALVAAALLGGIGFATTADAQGVIRIGSGRLLPTLAAMVGLIGVFVGRLALARSRRTGNGLARAIVATVLGMISLVIGGLHATYSAGGFGTGNGLAGAIVAIVLGLVGMVLGGLALARSRRS